MRHSDNINELAAALAKAQGAFINPPRTREVSVTLKDNKGTYKFAYSPLSEIMDVIRKPLSDNGLSIAHALDNDDKGVICNTVLMHASGQWISCWVPVIVSDTANAQGWGSALTYAKRQGITALLAIASDEDDDGNASCGNQATGRDRAAVQRKPAKPNGQKPEPTKPVSAPMEVPMWANMTETDRGEKHASAMNRVADAHGDVEKLRKIMLFAVAMGMNGKPMAELLDKIWNATTDEAFRRSVEDQLTALDSQTMGGK